MLMTNDSTECGPIIFFPVQVVSGPEGINCGRLCFQKRGQKEAIRASVSEYIKRDVGGQHDLIKVSVSVEWSSPKLNKLQENKGWENKENKRRC